MKREARRPGRSGRSAPSVPGRRAHRHGRSAKPLQAPPRLSPPGGVPESRDATTVVGLQTPYRPFPPPRIPSPKSVHFSDPISVHSSRPFDIIRHGLSGVAHAGSLAAGSRRSEAPLQ